MEYVEFIMKENKSVVTSPTTRNIFFQFRSLSAVTLFRIAFGIVWLVDGSMKFLWVQPSDVVKLVQDASFSDFYTNGFPSWYRIDRVILGLGSIHRLLEKDYLFGWYNTEPDDMVNC